MKFYENAIGKFFKSNKFICFVFGIDIPTHAFKVILISFDSESSISLEYMDFNEVLDEFELCTKEEFMEYYNQLIEIFTNFLKLS